MNGPNKEAWNLLDLAHADLNALREMLNAAPADRECFPDAIFGFHAQQAVEKALNAWLMLPCREIGAFSSRAPAVRLDDVHTITRW